MSDKHDTPPGTGPDATPLYRVRKPANETATSKSAQNAAESSPAGSKSPVTDKPADKPAEIGGPKGPEPTRFGDWERDGRCVDF